MNKDIYPYILALTNLYGMVHKEKVTEIYNLQNTGRISIDDVEEIQKNLPEEIEAEWIEVHKGYFVKTTVLEYDEFQYFREIKGNKPYYIPEKEELMRYTDDFYFEKNRSYYDVLSHLKKYFKGNEIEAENMADEIQSLCQFDFKMQHIVDRLEEMNVVFKSQNDLEKMISKISELANNTRIWENNGYTPNEMAEIFGRKKNTAISVLSTSYQGSVEKVKMPVKVGRNDPCPCGSGKKYKNCCLIRNGH